MSDDMRDIQLHHIDNLSSKDMAVENQGPLINANFKCIADELARINKIIKDMAVDIDKLNTGFWKISKYLNNQ